MPQSIKYSPLSCRAGSSLETYSNLWRSFTVCMDRVRQMHSKLNSYVEKEYNFQPRSSMKWNTNSLDTKPTSTDNVSGWFTTLLFVAILLSFVCALVVYLKNRNAKISIVKSDSNLRKKRKNIGENIKSLPEDEATEQYQNIKAEQENNLNEYKYQNSCENILKVDNSYQSVMNEQQDMILNWELMHDQEIEDDQDKISNQDRVRTVEELTAQDEMLNYAFLIGQDEYVRSRVIDRLCTHDQGHNMINQNYDRNQNYIMEDQEIRTRDNSRRSQTRIDQECYNKVKDERNYHPYIQQSPRYPPDSCNSSFNMIGFESEAPLSEERTYHNHFVQSLIENTAKLQAREEFSQAKEQMVKEVRDALRIEADIETKYTAYKADVEMETSVNLDLISETLKNLRNSPCDDLSVSYAVDALNCLYTGMSFGHFVRKKTYENHSRTKLRRSL